MKETLKLDLGKLTLEGDLTFPSIPKGLVLFAHGSGSGRFSPRNGFIAQYLNKKGYATFLFDLYALGDPELDQQEFNLRILSSRLKDVTVKLKSLPFLAKLPVGYYGSSTGAAVVLRAASLLPGHVHAVVSRGGRTDLVDDALSLVQAPTLLLVGENDPFILKLNRASLDQIETTKTLKIIPNAGHLFEEAGALEAVAMETVAWFKTYLGNYEPVKKEESTPENPS